MLVNNILGHGAGIEIYICVYEHICIDSLSARKVFLLLGIDVRVVRGIICVFKLHQYLFFFSARSPCLPFVIRRLPELLSLLCSLHYDPDDGTAALSAALSTLYPGC